MQVQPIDRLGRPLGPKGSSTKRALLVALEWELDFTGWREISVSSVTRKVGVSLPAFYQYFYRIEDAVIELAEAKLENDEPLSEHMQAILHLIALGRE